MEQRSLQEVAGTCLTEIAAAMNQAPETTSTSSLHKYPWARSCVFPQRSPSWGLFLGSWKKRTEGGGGGNMWGIEVYFFIQGGPGPLRARKGFSVKVLTLQLVSHYPKVTDV